MTAITSGFLAALECTKFVFGQGRASDLAGRAYSAPPGPVVGLRGMLFLRERVQPPMQIPGSAPEKPAYLNNMRKPWQDNFKSTADVEYTHVWAAVDHAAAHCDKLLVST